MNNNNQTIRKQHYTSTVVITIVGVLIFIGLCIYLYNVYKDFIDKLIEGDGFIKVEPFGLVSPELVFI